MTESARVGDTVLELARLVDDAPEIDVVFVQGAELLDAEPGEAVTVLELFDMDVDRKLEDDPSGKPEDMVEKVTEVFDRIDDELLNTELVEAGASVEEELVNEEVKEGLASEVVVWVAEAGSPVPPVLPFVAVVDEERVNEAEELESDALDTVELELLEVVTLFVDVANEGELDDD